MAGDTNLPAGVTLIDGFPFDSSPNLVFTDQGYPRGDRSVDAWVMQRVFKQFFSNGVFGTPANALQINKGASGLTVTIQPGMFIIDGAMGGIKAADGPMVLTLDTKAAQGNVCYGIMLRYDNNPNMRGLGLRVVKGTAATTPVPPAPDQASENVYELRLGYVTVPNGATDLTSATVTNEKGLAVCPYAAPFDEIDIDSIVADAKNAAQEAYSKFIGILDDNEEFIQNAIDSTMAGHLQTQIDAVKSQLNNFNLSDSVDNDTIFYEKLPLTSDKKLIAKPKVDDVTVHSTSDHTLYATTDTTGKIGDYTVLASNNVAAAIFNGGKALSVEYFDLKQSPFNAAGPNHQAIILPDGRTAEFGFSCSSSGASGGYTSFFTPGVCIYSTEGVATVYTGDKVDAQDCIHTPGMPFVVSINADSYPCKIIMAVGGIKYSYGNMPGAGVVVSTITITDSGSVTFSSKATANTRYGTNYGISYCDGPAYDDAGNAYVVGVHKDSNKYYPIYIKITPQGTASPSGLGPASTSSVSSNFVNSAGGIDGKCYFYCHNTGSDSNGIVLDTATGGMSIKTCNLPTKFNLPYEGSITSLDTDGNVIKHTYTRKNVSSDTTGDALNLIYVYTFGKSYVNSAEVLLPFGSDTAMYLNTGSNCRSVFYGDNNITAYGINTPDSISNVDNIHWGNVMRNKYRMRTIENSVYLIFDNSSKITLGNYTDVESSTLTLVKVTYDKGE